ncbi:MAG TPA: hypothetical protein VFB03_02000 [Candidatus Saccharimonadales bacterium]|nr:hypothetical protein [Candidatus Saccharimonadales bacterium]
MSANNEASKLFEIPEDGRTTLPDFEESSNPEARRMLLRIPGESQSIFRPDEGFWQLDFGDSGKAYLMPFLSFDRWHSDYPPETHRFYVADFSRSGGLMGYSYSIHELRRLHSPPPNNPFEGFTTTSSPYTRRGLGLRRLVVLNEACKRSYGKPLGSGYFLDSSPDAPARKAWKNLVRRGLATVTSHETYRFNP